MRYTSTRKATAAFIVCAWSSLAFGHSFTNHAGHAVSGELTSISNNVAVISGRRVPLSVFPPREQERMRKVLGIAPPPTPRQRELDKFLDDKVKRIDALEKAGAISAEEAKVRRTAISARRSAEAKR